MLLVAVVVVSEFWVTVFVVVVGSLAVVVVDFKVTVWNASHSILSCPLPRKLIVFFSIGFVYSSDLWYERIVWIGIT